MNAVAAAVSTSSTRTQTATDIATFLRTSLRHIALTCALVSDTSNDMRQCDNCEYYNCIVCNITGKRIPFWDICPMYKPKTETK